MDNKTIFAYATTLILLLAGCGVLIANGSDTSEGAATHNITVAQAQTWSYSITTNLSNPSFSISGTATNWVTLSGNTVSGTVPAVGSSATTLVITATTTQPTQSTTQTINFTIVEGVGLTLGDSVNGVLNLTTHHLAITGMGAMYNWEAEEDTPLAPYLGNVTNYIGSIDIGENVTTVGDCFGFDILNNEASLDQVTSITGGEGLTYIGDSAFDDLSATSVPWTSWTNLQTIGDYAFAGANMSEIILPNSVSSVGTKAFFRSDWTTLAIGSGLQSAGSIGEKAFGYRVDSTDSDVTFYLNDGTSLGLASASPNKVDSNVFTRASTTSGSAYSVFATSVTNTTYSTEYAYVVSGASASNIASEDNISLTISVSPYTGTSVGSTAASLISDAFDSGSWTVTTSVGSLAIGTTSSTSSSVVGAFSSGAAPTLSGGASSTYSTGVIFYGTDDDSILTLSIGSQTEDTTLDFSVLVVAVLEITSTP